ncbi:MAG: glycoside hydrolase [Acidobacteriota bacterium]|nr:glycoside hydrolase [Acidobacteriota bacterium]
MNTLFTVVGLALLFSSQAIAQSSGHDHHAAVNERGDKVMGFSHEKTAHHFLLKPDGGLIEVEIKDKTDAASRDQIQSHLKHIAQKFAAGDFTAPMLIHDKVPPGVPVMKDKKSAIKYQFEQTELGGRIRMTTGDATAIAAIHKFLRFQISDHKTEDSAEIEKTTASAGSVNLLRAPDHGLQPQAVVDERGALHLIYFAGEPSAGDIFYVRRAPGKAEFSAPLRVNSQPGSAVAIGTMRGAHIAIGKNGRIHISWNGSSKSPMRGPRNSEPMLYARMNDAGTAFEAERNLMQVSHELDGGGSLTSDKAGNVYVAWHGGGEQKGEDHRRVWLAASTDDGKTFAREVAVDNGETGACGCCGMRAFVDRDGALYLLYRTATAMTERGMFLLTSTDQGRSFRGERLDEWTLTTCPMSSVTMTSTLSGAKQNLAAWENNGQVFFAAVNRTGARSGSDLVNISAPDAASEMIGKRKHPAIATNARGETILVWAEGTAWKKGGSLAWQVFDREGKLTVHKGAAPDMPVWGLATVVAESNNSFTIFY